MSVRLLLAPLLLALLLLASAPAAVHAQGKSDPTELWEEFPLDPSASPTAEQVEAAPRPERLRVVARDEGPGRFAIVSLMLLAAGIGAMAVSLARGRARSRAREQPAATQEVAAKLQPAPEKPADAKPQPALGAKLKSALGRLQPAKPRPAPSETLQPVSVKPPEAEPRPAPAMELPAARVEPALPRRPVRPPAPPVPRTSEKPPAPAPRHPAAKPPLTPPPAWRRARAPQPAKPPGHVPAAPSAAVRPGARGPAPQPAVPGWQTCRIRLWHGYINKQFYAESPDSGEWVAQSAFFRVEEGHTIDHSRNAAEALDALVDELVDGGWEITGRRRGWHLALRRRTNAARPAVRQRAE